MNNRWSPVQKVTVLTALGLLGGMACSWPLWYAAARTSFPLLPVIGSPHAEEGWLSLLSAGVLLLLLTTVLAFPDRRMVLAALLGCLALLCCLDLNRLQPWVWLYALIFGIVWANQSATQTRTTLQWLLAAMYAWSGFHKLTPYFAEDNFAWFSSAFPWTERFGHLRILGYLVALSEMLLAVGLLWVRTRPVFRWLVVGFHAVIVWLLGPWGLNWNAVVIPWNITLAGLVWLVYAPPYETQALPTNKVQRLLLVLAGVAPVLQFAGAWPEAMSWKLYSNTQPEATFYAPANSFTRTVEEEALWQAHAFDHGTKLLLDDWANAELHTPMFAAERCFRQTAFYLCSCTKQLDSAGLYILRVQPWNRRAEQWQKIPCRNLLNMYK